MCPLCLTTLAVTVATTAGAGAAAAALAFLLSPFRKPEVRPTPKGTNR